MEVLLFGGTAEGRMLADWLAQRGSCDVVYCCTTKYGSELVAECPRVTTLQGPLTDDEKRALMGNHDFACVIDATHPYAEHISASVDELGAVYGVDVVRVAREDEDEQGDWQVASDVSEAVRLAAGSSGNVLLTTGSKDLSAFVAAMPDFRERLYVRILPMRASLDIVERVGIPARHVIAMQGPFSERMNKVLIEEFKIAMLVTKRSGVTGGFGEKVRAARACGIELVVIERPEARAGMPLEDVRDLLRSRYGL